MITISVYDQNTSENEAVLWKILTEAHDRELNSQYEIVLGSVRNIYFDTRYHLRAANDVRITRNGPTEETVYGTRRGTALKIKADKNFVTTYSSYKVTTKGDESITSVFSSKVYMGFYEEMRIGASLTVSLAKSIFNLGASLQGSILNLSTSVLNGKLYVGATLGTPGVRMIVQLRAMSSVQLEIVQPFVEREVGEEVFDEIDDEIKQRELNQEEYMLRRML